MGKINRLFPPHQMHSNVLIPTDHNQRRFQAQRIPDLLWQGGEILQLLMAGIPVLHLEN